MQRKLSNNMKLLKALGNGPKTQAELMRETKVKNTYQIVADLVKKGLVTKENGLVTRKLTLQEPNKKPEPVSKVVPNEHLDRIAMLKDEIDNIEDGIRALSIARSYLLRRCQEESKNA